MSYKGCYDMLDLSKNIINTDYLHNNLYSYTNISQIEKEVTSAASFSYSLLKKIYCATSNDEMEMFFQIVVF